MTVKIDWDPIRDLSQHVLEQGAPLELTSNVRALLRRSAREVAIPAKEAEKALHSLSTAMTLLRKIRRRIWDGSSRLIDAERRARRLQDAGNLKGAREQIEKVLLTETVPLYRQQAQSALTRIDRLQKVADSGRVDPKLSGHSQLFILLHRVQQGKPLKLTHGMRAFLRHAAAEVAIGEKEPEESLASAESAETLLQRIVERRRKGTKRLERALLRMMERKDAGDLEGARQQMRDLLAVEVVPVYRRAAEENLAGLDEPSPP
jgi:DUSAM domain-containing protein